MKQIKIQKEFWDKIVSGKKKFEFRKLEKGITTGTYEFVSVEKYCDHCGKGMNELPQSEISCYQMYYHNVHDGVRLGDRWFNPKVFGTAKLKPFAINTMLREYVEKNICVGWEIDYYGRYSIDEETYNFVIENYKNKKVDFVAYTILEVKEKYD